MKTAVFVAVAISLLAVGQPIPKQQDASNERSDKGTQIQSLSVAPIGQPAAEAEQTSSQDKYQSVWKKAFAPGTWSQWGLFLVAIIASYAAVKTLRAIEKQSGVTMGIERAHIATYWNQVIHIDMSPTGIRGDGHLSHFFNWGCGNFGRTQAQLRCVWSRFIVIKSLADLRQNPDYTAPNERPYDGEPLQPNADKMQTNWFSTPLESDLSFDEIQQRHRVQMNCVLYAYGYVKYFDVWGHQHEGRFGVVRVPQYHLTEDTWVVAGPPAYNRSA